MPITLHRSPMASRGPGARRHDVFYSTGLWRRFRQSFLSEHPLCEECLMAGRTTPATEIHHRIPRRLRPGLELEERNLEALCKSCHSKKTQAEGRS